MCFVSYRMSECDGRDSTPLPERERETVGKVGNGKEEGMREVTLPLVVTFDL